MFDKTEEYILVPELQNYLVEVYGERVDIINSIFNHFSSINSVYSLGLRYKLDALENKLLDVISTVEDTPDAMLFIEEYLRKLTVDFFKRVGLLIDYDRELLTLEVIEDFLNSLVTILFLDCDHCASMITEIELDDINGDEKLMSLIGEYLTVGDDVVFKMILSVSDDFFKLLHSHFKAKIYRGSEDVNMNDLKKIEPLLLYSKDFAYGRFIKNGLYFGFFKYKLEEVMETIYKTIDMCSRDPKEIAYELFAINFLSTDKPILKGEDIETYINIKPALGDDYLELLDNIISIYNILATDIKG